MSKIVKINNLQTQELATIKSVLPKFKDLKVLCIGDVMLDTYIHGQIERISPEAPIPVLKASHRYSTIGGAGNLATNIASLGGSSYFASIVGKDSSADEIKKIASVYDNLHLHLFGSCDRPTIMKTRYISQNQQVLRIDNELCADISIDDISSIVQYIHAYINKIDIVVISDYGKGLVTDGLCAYIIQVAHAHDKKVIIDPKGVDYTKYKNCDFITPNLTELSQATGADLHALREDLNLVTKAAKKLISKYNIETIIVTMSEQGILIVSRDKKYSYHIPTLVREVYDVSGAGDTVVAVFSLCMAFGLDHFLGAYLANLAAGIVVRKSGTATVNITELRDKILHVEDTFYYKVKEISEVIQTITNWQHQGLKVGFTNGCFDLIHPGHITLLAKSRAHCDKLIVAINSDNSVKRLKGESRPIQKQKDRAYVLASISSVDIVTIFNEDTPLEFIKQIKPDVLIKGGDYKLKDVVGADIVTKNGGEVVLIDYINGHSTTQMVKKSQNI